MVEIGRAAGEREGIELEPKLAVGELQLDGLAIALGHRRAHDPQLGIVEIGNVTHDAGGNFRARRVTQFAARFIAAAHLTDRVFI